MKPAVISDAEWSVMRVLWDAGETGLASSEVVSAVAPGRDWSPKTVKTLLSRLVKKGAVTASADERNAREYRYAAAVTRAACERSETRSFIERVFGGATSPMLAHLVEDGISEAEAHELRKLLDDRLSAAQGLHRSEEDAS